MSEAALPGAVRRRSLSRRVIGPRGFIRGRVAHHAAPTVAALVISGGALFNGFNSALGEAIACIATVSLLAGLLLLQPPSLRLWRRAAPVLLPVAGAIIWARVAASNSLAPDLFVPRFLGFMAGVAALLAGLLVGLRAQRVPVVVDRLIALNAAYLLFGLAIRAGDAGGAFDYWNPAWHGRFAGTIGNANVTAAVGGVVAMLSLARLIERSGPRQRKRTPRRGSITALLYAFAIIIGVGVTIAAASRFVFAGTVLALVPMAGWVLLRDRRGARRYLRLLAAGGIAAAILSTPFTGLLFERFGTLGTEAAARQEMWAHYAGLAVASPWVGYGPGAFQSMNLLYLGDPRLAESLWTINSPHNLLLQFALGAGLPYLLLLLAAAVSLARDCVAHARRGGWGIGEVGLAAAVIVVITSGMVDIAMDVPATIILSLFLAGLLWARALAADEIRVASPQRPPAQQQRRIAP